MLELEFRRAGRGDFHQLVIEEGNPRLQPPGHGHVIDALDRIVDDQRGHVKAQYRVEKAVGTIRIQVFFHQRRGVVLTVVASVHGGEVFAVIAIDITIRKARQPVFMLGTRHLRIPEVPGKDFVCTLPALHHLDRLRDPFRQQVEGHRILTEHGFGHGIDRFR